MHLSMLVYTGQMSPPGSVEALFGTLLNPGEGNDTDKVKQVVIGVNQEEGPA